MITDSKKSEKIVFVYTTCKDKKEARHLAYSAVGDKLAVCADFWPISSIYPWQGVIEDTTQYMVVFTTEKVFAEKLASFIEGLHSYKFPMVAVSETDFINTGYAIWADRTLQSREDYISQDNAEKKRIFENEDGYHPGELN